MTFAQALCIRSGITAVIGSGGKTTLLATLARELQAQGTVLLCTTTRIYPPAQTVTLCTPREAEVRQALADFGVVCVGAPAENSKLGEPDVSIEKLCQLADYVLVEADGSKGLPLKAHAAYEPVIPPEANQTVCVVGLSGLGRPILQAAHRSARYAQLAQAAETDVVTPELAARVLEVEALGDRFLLNQAEGAERQALGRMLAGLLSRPAVLGSLKERITLC